MIVVTGAAGFIGSCLVAKLNQEGFNHVVVVDKFDNDDKNKNLRGKQILESVDRDHFIEWLGKIGDKVEFIFHLGARTDTAEFDKALLNKMNTEYTKQIWLKCIEHQIPLVYASSAATYGLGEYGYDDSTQSVWRF
jgi:ADP-L-glycero-D-manno-heptose 6-epimerase